jgi:two-component system sensor histidine kinase RegB
VFIISNDLIDDYAYDPALVKQLNTLYTQIKRCKEILSSITQEAGVGRAEILNHIPLKYFIEQAINRWQDTRPATELVLTINANQYHPNIVIDSTL